jgi:O-antigen/teichoic acid export membrane protein
MDLVAFRVSLNRMDKAEEPAPTSDSQRAPYLPPRRMVSRLLPRGRFARSVSLLAGGTAGSQLLLVLTSPILSRLYTPTEFGVLAVFAAIVAIFAVIVSLRYQLAIPLPAEDKEATHVMIAAFASVAMVVTFVGVAVALFGAGSVRRAGVPELAPYLWLLPPALLILGIYQVSKYWAIRVHAFRDVAGSQVTQALSAVVVQIVAFPLGALALILGQIAGQSAGAGRLFAMAVRDRWPAVQSTQGHQIWSAAKRYKQFPLYSTWGALFNVAGSKLPSILFAVLFSPASAGMYFLAHRVLAMPVQLIGRSVADVLLGHAARALRNGSLDRLIRLIYRTLVQVAVPPALLVVITAPDLFATVFGSDWRQAGQFAQWMIPWTVLVFVVSPLSTLTAVVEKEGRATIFQIILLTVRVGTLTLGEQVGGLMLAVALFALGSAVCWLGFLIWVILESGNSVRVLIDGVGRALLWALLIASPFFAGVFVPLALSAGLALAMSVGLLALRYALLYNKLR